MQIKKANTVQSSLFTDNKWGEQDVDPNVNIYKDFYQDIYAPVEFKPRTSILCDYDQSAPLRKSLFFGYYQLFFMFTCFFFVVHPVLKFYETGKFIEPYLFLRLQRDFSQSTIIFPIFIIQAHSAFILQKLVIWGLPRWLEFMLQHITQLLVLILALLASLNHPNWYTSTRCFVAIMSISFYCKMHSYTVMNQRYRDENKITPGKHAYPQNINWRNFLYFIWAPTLIYQINYPKNNKFRLDYFIRKSLYTIAGFLAAYIVITDWLLPILEKADKMQFYELLLSLIEVVFYLFIILFFTVWEQFLNVFAEITYFADREFYRDWWNSTCYYEFQERWDRPISDFLQVHVYEILFKKFQNKHLASSITTIISGLMHELVLIITLQSFEPFIFVLLLLQIPFYFIFERFKGREIGNFIFWIAFIVLFPLVITCILKFNGSFMFTKLLK